MTWTCIYLVLISVSSTFSASMIKVKYPYDVFLTPKVYTSCEVAYRNGYRSRGIYSLKLPILAGRVHNWAWIFCNNSAFKASTVILYRENKIEEFNRTWSDYVVGFGSPKTDYWIGLENIRNLTESGNNVLTISIEDIYGKVKSIRYNDFKLGPRPKYTLSVGPGYGNLPDDLWDHNGADFHAKGNEDVRSGWIKSCVALLKVGWWFRPKGACAYTLLTGKFEATRKTCRIGLPIAYCDGVYWSDWTGFQTLKSVTMELSSI